MHESKAFNFFTIVNTQISKIAFFTDLIDRLDKTTLDKNLFLHRQAVYKSWEFVPDD